MTQLISNTAILHMYKCLWKCLFVCIFVRRVFMYFFKILQKSYHKVFILLNNYLYISFCLWNKNIIINLLKLFSLERKTVLFKSTSMNIWCKLVEIRQIHQISIKSSPYGTNIFYYFFIFLLVTFESNPNLFYSYFQYLPWINSFNISTPENMMHSIRGLYG